jgi:hypothetical protein
MDFCGVLAPSARGRPVAERLQAGTGVAEARVDTKEIFVDINNRPTGTDWGVIGLRHTDEVLSLLIEVARR